MVRQVMPSKKNRNEIDKLVVDSKEFNNRQVIANSLNEYFTTIASSLLAGRKTHDNSTELQQSEVQAAQNNIFNFLP